MAITQPKNLLIDTLREMFRGNSRWNYVSDQYGFPLLPDDPELNISEGEATGIIISDVYRYEGKMFPSIVVAYAGGNYKPVSFNQNECTTSYEFNCFLDENNRKRFTRVPKSNVFAGAWDQNFDVIISAEDITSLYEISEIAKIGLINIFREDLINNGLFVRNISMGGEDKEEYGKDFIYRQKLTIETRSEWRREIPIGNLVETILFSIGVQFFGTETLDLPVPIQLHQGGRNVVGNALDIITIAGELDGVTTEDLNLSNTEEDIFS